MVLVPIFYNLKKIALAFLMFYVIPRINTKTSQRKKVVLVFVEPEDR